MKSDSTLELEELFLTDKTDSSDKLFPIELKALNSFDNQPGCTQQHHFNDCFKCSTKI
jgi:hypothetical protein